MKSTGFLATFIIILFVKNIHGQQNQDVETNNMLPQQQTTNTLFNSIQRYLNQKRNAGALLNQNDNNQVQIQKNILPCVSSPQQIQQPPDIIHQPKQIQQILQQQQPLQIQQSLQFQPLQTQSTLQLQQPSPQQQLLQPQLSKQEIQQPLSLQQVSQPPVPNVDLFPPSNVQQQSYQTLPNSNLQLQPSILQETINLGQPLTSKNLVVHSQNHPKHIMDVNNIVPQASFNSEDVSSMVYYGSPQQSSSQLTVNTPMSSNNPSIALIPSYNSKSSEQTHVPPYNYIIPSPDIQVTVVDKTKAINSVSALPSVLTIPPIQSANSQTYYYNPSIVDLGQNSYINQNSQVQYSQPKIQMTPIQTQPTAAIPSQPSVLSSFPLPLAVAQTSFPQYGIPSGYPVNTIMAPAYTTKKSTTSSLKSLLPIIFNLLRQKITSCGCQNSCPCDCKNKDIGNELEVLSGYSSFKNYGALNEDNISVINTASKEIESSGCHRERKNLKNNNETTYDSEEDIEDDDSEEEVEEDEEEEEED